MSEGCSAPFTIDRGRDYTQETLLQEIQSISRVRRKPLAREGRCDLELFESCMNTAQALNEAHHHLPEMLRRLLRKQGRIDRALTTAAEQLLQLLMSNGKVAQSASDQVENAERVLVEARFIQHSGRGKGIIKRIHRDQGGYNRAIAEACRYLARGLRQTLYSRDEEDAGINSHFEHMDWHIKEAFHLQTQYESAPAIIRRARRKQFQINRCIIVALHHMRLLTTYL